MRAAAGAMGAGKSTMDKWVRQLRSERDGKTPQATRICNVFGVNRSSYKYWLKRTHIFSPEKAQLFREVRTTHEKLMVMQELELSLALLQLAACD